MTVMDGLVYIRLAVIFDVQCMHDLIRLGMWCMSCQVALTERKRERPKISTQVEAVKEFNSIRRPKIGVEPSDSDKPCSATRSARALSPVPHSTHA